MPRSIGSGKFAGHCRDLPTGIQAAGLGEVGSCGAEGSLHLAGASDAATSPWPGASHVESMPRDEDKSAFGSGGGPGLGTPRV